MLAPLYTLRPSGDKLCVVYVSGKLCFWDKSSPTFELCTASGELAVICWAIDIAVERTSDAGTTVFTLYRKCKVSASTKITRDDVNQGGRGGNKSFAWKKKKDGQIGEGVINNLQPETISRLIRINRLSCQQHFRSELHKHSDKWVALSVTLLRDEWLNVFTWCPTIFESRGIPRKAISKRRKKGETKFLYHPKKIKI